MSIGAQGSCATCSSRPASWNKGKKPKQYVAALRMVGRADSCMLMKNNVCLSVGAPCVRRTTFKILKISAFKGSPRNDEAREGANGSKAMKNSFKIRDGDETLKEIPKANNVPLSYVSETNDGILSSPAIHKLFKSWLTILRTQSLSQEVQGIVKELPSKEISETEDESYREETVGILKAVWSHFLALDAMIKIPLLVFIPLYLGVNVFYGSEVSKDLTPFWTIGPCVLALYVKTLKWLLASYVFCFKQTAKIASILTTYSKEVYIYIAQGRMRSDVRHPIDIIRNLDYNELSRGKLRELKEWQTEKYIDFIESVWPTYCGLIRLLKRAKVI